jgi:hypothetical protein
VPATTRSNKLSHYLLSKYNKGQKYYNDEQSSR